MESELALQSMTIVWGVTKSSARGNKDDQTAERLDCGGNRTLALGCTDQSLRAWQVPVKARPVFTLSHMLLDVVTQHH